MAGSDPKTSRALGQAPDRNDIDADEDPLIELARIVSEDGGFSGPRPEKPKAVPRAEPRPEPVVRDALADGLEAELLQELETSFAAREIPVAPRAPAREPTPAREPAPAPRPAPATVRVEPIQHDPIPEPVRVEAAVEPASGDPDPDELLRSIEEQLSQFERRQSSRFATSSFSSGPADDADPVAELAPEPDAAWDAPAEEQKDEAPFGAPTQREEWQGRRASRIRPFAEIDDTTDEAPEPAYDEPAPQPVQRPGYRFRGPASAEWDRESPAGAEEIAEPSRDAFAQPEEPLRLRGQFADTDLFAEAELAPTMKELPRSPAEDGDRQRGGEESPEAQRRERRKEAFPEFDEQPAAARAQPDLAAIEAGLSRALEPRYAEPAYADKWQDGDAPAEESRVAAAIAPGPSRRAAAARAAAAQRGRSRTGLLTTAGVILVVLIGAGGAYFLRASDQAPSGPPPVIAAEEGAVRVEASPQQAAEGETVGEAVYNRVAGTAPETEEQVVDSAEEPREIARIVLPPTQSDAEDPLVRPVGGEEGTDAASSSDAAPAPAVASGDEIGPRRVPTFVVRADGTIVTTTEAGGETSDPAAAQADQLATESQPIEPVPVPTVAIAEAGSATEGASPASPTAVEAAPEPAPSVVTDDLVTRPTIDEPPAEVAVAAPAEPAPAPAPAAEAVPAEELAAAAPAEATPPPATTGDGYFVQLSAQRSAEQAQDAYATAQRNYPSVLGNLSLQVQEANLGEKGIYFRVRVGPWSRDEAIGVCESLKAAGGNCFVTQ